MIKDIKSVSFTDKDDDLILYLATYVREPFAPYVKRLIREDMIQKLGLEASKKEYTRVSVESYAKSYVQGYTKNYIKSLVEKMLNESMHEADNVTRERETIESMHMIDNMKSARVQEPAIQDIDLDYISNTLADQITKDDKLKSILGNQLNNLKKEE